jgi:uncharacterized protein YegP (UPF0339 family)
VYFDVLKDASAKPSYYFAVKGDNNETVFRSETYTTKQSALNAIEMIRREAADAKVFDETGETDN